MIRTGLYRIVQNVIVKKAGDEDTKRVCSCRSGDLFTVTAAGNVLEMRKDHSRQSSEQRQFKQNKVLQSLLFI